MPEAYSAERLPALRWDRPRSTIRTGPVCLSSPEAQQFPTVGRYQVINRIATGGMAEVFLARAVGAMGFQRLVAVKLIHANFTRDTEFVNMFIDEARIAMHLHHRNIVQVFDLDSEGETYFIAMEFVHGVNVYDLYERLAAQNRWVEVPMALYVVAEVCKGLHFAHTRVGANGVPLGIVHRDISPQNVLLSFEGEVKITDFGIATAAERLHKTAAGVVKGKYAYMAPERLQEEPSDARVDVFACGVLLYELLAGENPFAGPSAVDTIENVISKAIPAPSQVGAPVEPALDEIVLKALAKDPNERYQSAQELSDALTEYALSLSEARKEMAAGDSLIAQTLKDLFADKAVPPTATDPGSLALPGVNDTADMGSMSTHKRMEAVSRDADPNAFATDEQLPSVPSNPPPRNLEETEDFDAPTLLRMTPVKVPQASRVDPLPPLPGEPPANALPEVISAPHLDGIPDGEFEDDPYGQTLPSTPAAQLDPTMPTPVVRVPGPSSSATSNDQLVSPVMSSAPLVTPVVSTPGLGTPRPDGLVNPVVSHVGPLPAGPSIPGAPIPTKKSNLNIIAAALLLVAALVAVLALGVLRNGGEVLVPAEIRTTPAGASVLLNGVVLPEKTPTTAQVAANSELTIEIELSGYHPLEKRIVPREGAQITVDEALTPLVGKLVVKPIPSQAEVSINGEAKGAGTVTLTDLKLDKPVTVEIKLKGYVTHQQEIRPTAQALEHTLDVALKIDSAVRTRVPRRRVLLKPPFGSWALVYYRNRKLGKTPVAAELPVGQIELRVKNFEAKLDKVISVVIPSEGAEEISLEF